MKLCIAIRQTALHLLLGALCILLNLPATAQPVVTFFHNDISGSPMVATDAAGNVVWKESYKPYGDKLRNEPASRNGKNNIGYAGSPFDASTGLSYMGARYYDPVIGRFMGIDPVGFQEDNIHSFNRYAYANNNPYRYIDQDGRQSTDILYNVWNRTFSNSAGSNTNGAAGFEIAKQGIVQGYFDGLKMSAEVGMTVSSLGLGTAATIATTGVAKQIGMLRDAASGKGNFGIGLANRAEVEILGKAWVGDGFTVSSNGKFFVSADKLRIYRPPSAKPNSSFATTGTQANLEQKLVPGGQPFSNAHVDVSP